LAYFRDKGNGIRTVMVSPFVKLNRQ
jgi:hypothetical protein